MANRSSSLGVQTLDELGVLVRDGWAAATSSDPERWSPENPAWGQCAVTALLVQDLVGGELLRANVKGTSHYWNRDWKGTEIDLTREQFGSNVRVGTGELRDRDYVLSFPETRRRYNQLRRRIRTTSKRAA